MSFALHTSGELLGYWWGFDGVVVLLSSLAGPSWIALRIQVEDYSLCLTEDGEEAAGLS